MHTRQLCGGGGKLATWEQSAAEKRSLYEDCLYVKYEQYEMLHEFAEELSGCIHTDCDFSPLRYDWLESESLLARVSFSAGTSSLSLLMDESTYLQSLFVNLAREGGATSCVFNPESHDVRVLYLDGEEQEYTYHISEDYTYNREDHPRYLRFGLKEPIPPKTLEGIRKLHFCGVMAELNWATDIEQEQLVRLTRDADSGVRSRACYALYLLGVDNLSPLAESIAREQLHDSDWRTRAVAEAILADMEKERQRNAFSA